MHRIKLSGVLDSISILGMKTYALKGILASNVLSFRERGMKMKVVFHSVNNINDFVNIVSRFSDEIHVSSNKSTVNAKSIIGICSLDLSGPVEVIVHGSQSEKIYRAIKKYAA